MISVLVVSATVSIGAASSVYAQTVAEGPAAPVPSPTVSADTPQRDVPSGLSAAEVAARDAELQRWMKDFTEWKRWWVAWANRREPGWLTSSRPRRIKPTPPAWLAGRCAEVFDDNDSLAPACALLDEWRQDNVTLKTNSAYTAAVQKTEDEPRIIWWEHVHVDLLWPATEVGTSVYGVIGVHTAATVKGRLQVFLAPGVMLLNVPTVDGTRVWKVAANYGIGYRLFDFTFPGKRRASLHVNVAKSWLVSDARDLIVSRNVDRLPSLNSTRSRIVSRPMPAGADVSGSNPRPVSLMRSVSSDRVALNCTSISCAPLCFTAFCSASCVTRQTHSAVRSGTSEGIPSER
jgi:hypothetical protein